MTQPQRTIDAHDRATRIVEAVEAAAGVRSDLAGRFARATLRRVPETTLAGTDDGTTTRWLLDAFDWIDQAPDGRGLSVRLGAPSTGFDDGTVAGTAVEVVGYDRPFLLATVTRTIESFGAVVIRRLHPILGTRRDAQGRLVEIGPARHADRRETFMHLELDRALAADEADRLRERLRDALQDVTRVTEDFAQMWTRVEKAAHHVRERVPTDRDEDAPDEVADLLTWLLDDNLVLLGWRAYDVQWHDDEPRIQVAPDSGLGLLRDETRSRFAEPTSPSELPYGMAERFERAPLLRVTRTRRRSTVHRLRPMLDIVLTHRDAAGRPVRVERLLGLFSAAGLGVPASRTPVLRDRLRRVLEVEDVVRRSHEEITLVGLFQSLPKDELLELDVWQIRDMLVTLLDAEEHHRLRVVVRTDVPTGTVTVVLAVPRDDYTPSVRQRVARLLGEHVDGPVDADVSMGEHAEVVVRFTGHRDDMAGLDASRLERAVAVAARPWLERTREALTDHGDDPASVDRWYALAGRMPASYRNRVRPVRALEDIVHLDALLESDRQRAVWLVGERGATGVLVAQRDTSLILSDAMPVLESLGLRIDAEHSHELGRPGPVVHLHEFRVAEAIPTGVHDAVTDTVLEALAGRLEVDGLNRLVPRAGLTPDQVRVVRAYRRYRRQVGTSYSAEYANAALADHPDAVRSIIELFRLRFDPDHLGSAEEVRAARAAANEACDSIERLDHDRIVRGILDLVDATLRTTAFVRDDTRGWTEDAEGNRVPVLAFKLDPSLVPDVPAPRPHREIFVSSPAVEGIHLRGGPIARGGLRFSDRHDDLRTEILGLMKAQMLKNALIVPTGAKGGFVCKRLPLDRAAARDDVQRQYVAFISALLDLTDDVSDDGQVVPPTGVVRHDDDDPYLVVAADKGTATFSDVANRVAEERGFWLGDAFASGGSSGYDHKKLGITARGAWTVIARHFAELGLDLQTDPVTVVGVGDMSGDVFGNGMLLSRSLRLQAAFDHRDVFVDPDPDPEVSYAERERLFALPGSSWQDYDRAALSPGGMVVSRASKSVEPTAEVRDLLGLPDGTVTPDQLMRAILGHQADLLWFGGIGTYVKASEESHVQVGDRINDEIRLDATDVRARVIGEGANLAITQRARIQYARRGGRVDQDAVHNAAGVDISDHEVNLKILLGVAESDGRLGREDRDMLLDEMSDDVVGHVLRDVDRQAAQLSRLSTTSGRRLDDLRLLLHALEDRGTVDRVVDVLPDGDELDERAEVGGGLTRPELATLMAGAKRVVSEAVLTSSLSDDPRVARSVETYFPARCHQEFGDLVPRHRLHRELVATVVANDLVDRLGPVWPFHLAEETGSDLGAVAAATLAAWHVVGATHWWTEMDVVDTLLPPERSLPLATELSRLIMGIARRYLDDPLLPDVAAVTERDREAFVAMHRALPDAGDRGRVRRHRAAATQLTDDLVDPGLADLLAGVADLGLVVDVASTARRLQRDPGAVADAMLRVAATLGLDRLSGLVERVPVDTRWERRERKGLAADVQRLHAAALRRGIAHVQRGNVATVEPDEVVDAAVQLPARRLTRVQTLLAEVETTVQPPLPAVSVLVRSFADLVAADE